ncbi:MAG: DUF5916 domain-containing protein [bacterium]
MRTSLQKQLLIILIILASGKMFAGESLQPKKTDAPPVIDGILNDPIWKDAISVTNFKTYIPDFEKNASEKTIAYLTYDNKNLYFAFKCFDSEPSKIKATLTTRDNIYQDDWVCINLDSFNDQQSLYTFYVNPLGIQMDSRVPSNVADEDLSVDLVWYSAGKIDDEGYTVELSVPLKSIRYSGANPNVMAGYFERRIARYSEHSTYPEFDPAKGYAVYCQLKEITFYDLESPTVFELLPAFTYSYKSEDNQGSLSPVENKGELSLTGKYGITSDLTFDGTYNPDFSQVEADAGQVDVNLRYDLYYPEKRPFFLEGNDIFKLGATSTSEVDPIKSLVHTRTIVNPLAGLKLTGKLSDDISVASIYALDDLQDRELSTDDKYAHFGIVRLKKSFSDDSFIGGIFTDRELKNRYNRVAGFDGRIRLSEASALEFNGLISFTKSGEECKPKGEHAIGVDYLNQTRDLEYAFTLKDISENFNTDAGYITRTNILSATGYAKPKFYPNSEIFRRLDWDVFSAQTKDKFSSKWETNNYTSLTVILPGDMNVKVKYSYSTEIFLNEKFNTGGFHIAGGGWLTNQFYLGFLYRRIAAIYYSNEPFQGKSNRLSISTGYLPSDNFEADLDVVFIDLYRESDNQKVFEYPLFRTKLSYQFNQYLMFRGIAEYNRYRKQLLTDFLASFTYIPGTVFHLGYGSFYEKIKWQDDDYVGSNRFLETQRGFFLKVSYLWRS